VVNTKLKEKANEDSRQKRIAEGKDVFPMSQAEKVRARMHGWLLWVSCVLCVCACTCQCCLLLDVVS
jgi:hypothetical protein